MVSHYWLLEYSLWIRVMRKRVEEGRHENCRLRILNVQVIDLLNQARHARLESEAEVAYDDVNGGQPEQGRYVAVQAQGRI